MSCLVLFEVLYNVVITKDDIAKIAIKANMTVENIMHLMEHVFSDEDIDDREVPFLDDSPDFIICNLFVKDNITILTQYAY